MGSNSPPPPPKAPCFHRDGGILRASGGKQMSYRQNPELQGLAWGFYAQGAVGWTTRKNRSDHRASKNRLVTQTAGVRPEAKKTMLVRAASARRVRVADEWKVVKLREYIDPNNVLQFTDTGKMEGHRVHVEPMP